ncbi:MAG: response regulator [Ruminiclostridium sp.]
MSLTKIMIVDDEINTLNLLKVCIDWEEIGCTIWGEANSGAEALDILQEHQPDIIVTDIQMLYMDGIELSKQVLQLYPHIKIVYLTAHQSFEYARQGLELGVCNYIVKPIKRTEIIKTIIQVKEQLNAERQLIQQHNLYKTEIDNSMDYLREKFLNELLLSTKVSSTLVQRLKFYGVIIPADSENYQIAIIDKIYDEDEDEEAYLLDILRLKKLLSKYIENLSGVLIFTDYYNRIVALNSDRSIKLANILQKYMRDLQNLGTISEYKVSIGIGNVFGTLADVKYSYQQAADAIKLRVMYGNNNIISYDEMLVGSVKKELHYNDVDNICFNIKMGLCEKCFKIIDEIFDIVKQSSKISISDVRIIAANIIMQIIKAISELGFELVDFFETNSMPFKYIMEIDNLPDIINYLKNYTQYVVEKIKQMRISKTSSLIKEIQIYLNQNYADSDISLVKTASKFFINQNFLCRIFKQETKVTFIECLTKIRMERAIELLAKTDLKQYEIAQLVGIPDPNYFGKCFKKFTGMTMIEYKSGK